MEIKCKSCEWKKENDSYQSAVFTAFCHSLNYRHTDFLYGQEQFSTRCELFKYDVFTLRERCLQSLGDLICGKNDID